MKQLRKIVPVILIGIMTMPMFNCGRSLVVVKKEMKSKPNIAVVAWGKTKLWVSGQLNADPTKKMFGKYTIYQNAEHREMPRSFKKIYMGIKEKIEETFPEYKFIYVDAATLPKKKGFMGIEVPNFSGVDSGLLFMVSLNVNYHQKSDARDKPPYTYFLKGKATVDFYKNTKKDVERLLVSSTGGYNLAEVSKQLPNTYSEQKNIGDLIKMMGPDMIYVDLATKASEGVPKFKADLAKAK